jgi:hypothetical protein
LRFTPREGEYRKTIAFEHDLLRDFGLDARGNLYVLGQRAFTERCLTRKLSRP